MHLRDTLPPLRLFPFHALTVTHPTPPTVTSVPTLTDSNYTFSLEQHQADTGDPPADGNWVKEEERGDRIGGGQKEEN